MDEVSLDLLANHSNQLNLVVLSEDADVVDFVVVVVVVEAGVVKVVQNVVSTVSSSDSVCNSSFSCSAWG